MKVMIKTSFNILIAFLCLFMLVACGDDSSSESVPSSGNSSVGAPQSVLGKSVLLKVTNNDGKPTTMAVGGTVTFSYVNESTIMGEGFARIPFNVWNYSYSGNVGTIHMESSTGTFDLELIFTSPTGGTFHGDEFDTRGIDAWIEGTFTLSPYTGGGGVVGNDPPITDSTTGQVAFWTSRSRLETGSIQVSVDNVYIGGLTKYYNSSPTCGDSGTITKTLSVGNHSYIAKDGNLSWGPANFTITSGGCLLYELQ